MLIWFDKDAVEKSETAQKREDRIAALDAIIDTLIGAMAKAAITSNMEEYRLDDGQTKVSVRYKDVAAISASITSLERTKQMYLNRQNGRMSRLIDSRNMPRMRWY